MKKWKRNAIIAVVLVLVCTGVYLNWLYTDTNAVELTSTLNEEKLTDDTLLVMSTQSAQDVLAASQDSANVDSADYFARMRLSRQESRDAAVELLQETISYAGENEDIESASAQLQALVSMSLSEAQIESLVIAKGYEDCVAYMTDENISVAVCGDKQLEQTDIAVLTDIITGQTDYELPQIRIIDVG